MIKRILFVMLSIISIISTYAQQAAQTGDIRGFVYDKKTGEPIIFTNVFIEGTTIGVATDVNGFYSLTKVKPGNYRLVSTGIGYDTTKVSISIKAGSKLTQNLFLSQKAVNL